MVGPDAARDGDTASPYGTKRKEREASPSVAIRAMAIAIMAIDSREGFASARCRGGDGGYERTQGGFLPADAIYK